MSILLVDSNRQFFGPPVRGVQPRRQRVGQDRDMIVPAGVAVFPREVFPPIRRFAERSNNIVHWSEFDRGGHFPAMEQPDLLVGDIRRFFRRCR